MRPSNVCRFFWNPVQKGIESLLIENPQSNKIVAQTSAMLPGTGQCFRHIRSRGQLGMNQQIT